VRTLVAPLFETAAPILWGVGLGATVVGVVAVLANLDVLAHRVFFRAVLAAATVGAAISALGVLKLMGVTTPGLTLFEGEASLVHFVAYVDVILYVILFFWTTNVAFADLAARVADTFDARRPIRKAEAAQQQGNYERAVSLYLRHLAEHREDYDAMRQYAGCLVRLGRFREAIEIYRRIVVSPNRIQALAAGVEIAHVLDARLGDAKAAQKEINALRETYAGTPFERELEARIALARKRDTDGR